MEGFDFARGVRATIRNDAAAFSYSILIGGTLGAVTLVQHPATLPRVFLFVVGAALAFTVAEAVASRGFTIRIREERGDVVVLGTSMAPLSVAASLGISTSVAHLIPGAAAWGLAPFAATITYVLLSGLQLALARRYEERHPPEDTG